MDSFQYGDQPSSLFEDFEQAEDFCSNEIVPEFNQEHYMDMEEKISQRQDEEIDEFSFHQNLQFEEGAKDDTLQFLDHCDLLSGEPGNDLISVSEPVIPQIEKQSPERLITKSEIEKPSPLSYSSDKTKEDKEGITIRPRPSFKITREKLSLRKMSSISTQANNSPCKVDVGKYYPSIVENEDTKSDNTATQKTVSRLRIRIANPCYEESVSSTRKSPKNLEIHKDKRWSKENDRQLFPVFLRLVSEAGLEPETFCQKEARISQNKREILERLKEQFNWNGKIYALRDRIKRCLTTNRFTAREKRVLHRMLREHQNGKRTLEEISTHFPGKSPAKIEEYKEKFFS